MTASEANRQRVLALLAIERQQMYEPQNVGEKKSPGVQRGNIWRNTISAPLDSSTQVDSLPTFKAPSSIVSPLHIRSA